MKRIALFVPPLLIALFAGSASAGDNAHDLTPDVARARGAFARGLTQANNDDLDGARRSFAAAYALVPSVDILWNLAITERKLDRHVDALKHLRAYAADSTARPDRKQLAESEIIPELVTQSGHLSINAPEGAVLELDGVPITSPILDVEPGVHEIGMTFGPLRDARAVNVASGGVETKVDMTTSLPSPPLSPSPSPSTKSPFLSVETAAFASTDQRNAATTAATASTRMWTILGLGGAALVSAAGGIVFATFGASDRAEAERLYTKIRDGGDNCVSAGTICPNQAKAEAAANREGAVSTTLFVASGVLAGAAIATWVLWPAGGGNSSKPHARVTPNVGVRSASVAFDTTF